MPLSRAKRQTPQGSAGTEVGATTFNLTTSNLQTTDKMVIGDVADYTMSILLPEGLTFDLLIEIYTGDPETGLSSIALCNWAITTGDQISPAAPTPVVEHSATMPNVVSTSCLE
ncbi:unnamed protein product [Cyprideis torosa]|uniref:Uncharacterized protein n=1 Tax=Cyprideis torosa TaxID=163714 RepID=A0A7R8W683_9CRUS|nr:unnamed protein product [Cyprideis torosa]CAG0886203.1 unnamed protein product [Cyprideis torosa]